MNEIDDIRRAAQAKQQDKKSSGAAIFCVALIIPLIGGAVGFIAKQNASANDAEKIEMADADDAAEMERLLKRAAANPAVKRQVALARDDELAAVGGELHKYNRTLNTLRACKRLNPGNGTYGDLIEKYGVRNKSAYAALTARMQKKTEAQLQKFTDLKDKVKSGNQAQQMVEIVKFSQGGGAARYANTMMTAMGSMSGGNVKATPALCKKTAENVMRGKADIKTNPS